MGLDSIVLPTWRAGCQKCMKTRCSAFKAVRKKILIFEDADIKILTHNIS